jgi:hypothetical protein
LIDGCREPHRLRGARWRPPFAGSPLVFVFENSHFGHLKVIFSAPLAPGSLPANSIRVRHIAQRGGFIGSGAEGVDWFENGMTSPPKRGGFALRNGESHFGHGERSEAIILLKKQAGLLRYARNEQKLRSQRR